MTTKVAVLIATKDRESELANRALSAVAHQTLPPDWLVVVDDSHRRHRDANRRIVDGLTLPASWPTRVRYMVNDRTPGASGAWNTGIDWLHRQVADPSSMYVAILDDDDRWEPSYLAACMAAATESGADIAAADIVRHEGTLVAGQIQPAPDGLDGAACLVTNPGIQGSNLFIRLSVLLAAGLFDESLSSCTDWDLCIRLADLGAVRYVRVPQALVHHHADGDRQRLSTPGSPGKLDGLTAFWRKYRLRMSEAQRGAFSD